MNSKPPKNGEDGISVVVAMDSFKESLDAIRACAAVARGARGALPGATTREHPLADGGEGTAETLRDTTGGRWVECRAAGPLPDRDTAGRYLRLPDAGPGALIEMAVVNGLDLLPPDRRDPMLTSTRGTGQLVADAVGRGARRIWLAIGGSATVDGGTGAARALGWRFEDARGGEVPDGGVALERIARIVPPARDPLDGVAVEVLCDVDNPLLGPRGAARIFGPQKGAGPAEVERLEAGLARLADRIEADLGLDVRRLPGAGAAGGLGAGAVAFMRAELVSGVDAVMEAGGFARALADADLVLTGEGSFDAQSLDGKVVSGVVREARAAGVPVGVVAGTVHLTPDEALAAGIDHLEAARPADLSLAEAMERADELVEAAAARLVTRWRADRG